MVNFIVRMIEQKAGANGSLEQGQELYRKYFVDTTLYSKYKEDVDAKLIADGYGDVIVSA